MNKESNEIVEKINIAFKGFYLGDIEKSLDKEMLIATFILCICFIDAVSGFYCGIEFKKTFNNGRVKYDNRKRFIKFCTDYLYRNVDKRYNPEQLFKELRNNIVHSYSASVYSLAKGLPFEMHLTPLNESVLLSAEIFYQHCVQAYQCWMEDLHRSTELQSKTIEWYNLNGVFQLNRIEIR